MFITIMYMSVCLVRPGTACGNPGHQLYSKPMAMYISAEFLHPSYCRLSESARRAAGLLYAMSQLLNQAVGDAVSDMLMVEAVLIHKKVCNFSLQAHCIYITTPHGAPTAKMFITNAPLLRTQWRCEDWIGMYEDLPNRQLKVKASL